MSQLLKILSKPIFIILVAAAVAIGISSAIVLFFVLPQYSDWTKSQEENKVTQAKIDTLSANIELIKSFDVADIDRYQSIINSFYPEDPDYLHFVTLSEELAKFAGVGITSLTISANKAIPGSAGATAPSIGPAAGSSSATATPVSPGAAIATGTYVQTSYKGNYKKVETLLSKLESLDRAVGVSKLSISQIESGNEVSATVTFFLPTAQKGLATASSENVIALTDADKKFLDEVEQKTEFFADPANNQLGKDNPFQ